MKDIVKQALKIAKKAHKGQMRNDGVTPYISHPIAVADNIVRNYHPTVVNDAVIATALLHDVIEDCAVTYKDLVDRGIPEYIVKSVWALTHHKDTPYLTYILAVKMDTKARLVKVEDIKHNLSTLENTKKNKHQRDKYLLAIYILEH